MTVVMSHVSPDLRNQQVPVFVVHSASKTQRDNYDSCDGDL